MNPATCEPQAPAGGGSTEMSGEVQLFVQRKVKRF